MDNWVWWGEKQGKEGVFLLEKFGLMGVRRKAGCVLFVCEKSERGLFVRESFGLMGVRKKRRMCSLYVRERERD